MDIKAVEAQAKEEREFRNVNLIAGYISKVRERLEGNASVIEEIAALKEPMTMASVATAKDAMLDTTAVWSEMTRLASVFWIQSSEPALQNRQKEIQPTYQRAQDAYRKITGWVEKL